MKTTIPVKSMKRTVLIAAMLAASTLCTMPASAQEWSDWDEIAAACDNAGNRQLLLSWRKFDHPGQLTEVQWRIVNASSRSLFDVTLGERTYTCSNGETRPSLSFGGSLAIQSGGLIQISDLLSHKFCPSVASVEFTGNVILVPQFASSAPSTNC